MNKPESMVFYTEEQVEAFGRRVDEIVAEKDQRIAKLEAERDNFVIRAQKAERERDEALARVREVAAQLQHIECMDAVMAMRRIEREQDEARDALRLIREWADAYSVNVFPEIDPQEWPLIHELLKDGLCDRLHASWARKILDGVKQYAARDGEGE